MFRAAGALRGSIAIPSLLAVLCVGAALGCGRRRADLEPAPEGEESEGTPEGEGTAPSEPAAPYDFDTAPRDWNPTGIAWREHAAGLAEARASGKPIMLIMHAEWCGPCHDYARVFYHPEVVALSRRFVMVLVDSDRDPGANQRYATDGTYLPRTYFLDSNGQHRTEVVGDHPRYRYFFNQRDATVTAAAMRRALP